MRVKYGRLMTKERVSIVVDYTFRREAQLWALTRGFVTPERDRAHHKLAMWVYDFERFMCNGFRSTSEGQAGQRVLRQESGALPAGSQVLDMGEQL